MPHLIQDQVDVSDHITFRPGAFKIVALTKEQLMQVSQKYRQDHHAILKKQDIDFALSKVAKGAEGQPL